MGEEFSRYKQVENALLPDPPRYFLVPGYSYPAGKVVNFAASYLYAVGSRVNWREVLICPVTGLNNRMRATAHILDMEFGIHPDDAIYISEQATPFYPGFPFWPWHGHRIHPRCAEYHVFSR